MMIRHTIGALSLLACGTAATAQDDALARMLRGEPALSGKALVQAIEKAELFPLGSSSNPVRAEMPKGQHDYLMRLRCADGNAPKSERAGNVGIGVFGNIVDLYNVTCPGSAPSSTNVYMDMYHRGYVENRPVHGFSMTP